MPETNRCNGDGNCFRYARLFRAERDANDALRKGITDLIVEWQERASAEREVALTQSERGSMLLEHSADGYDACAGELWQLLDSLNDPPNDDSDGT